MFCPKCGTENQEDMAYCRSCGDDLKIVSQAMKEEANLEAETTKLRNKFVLAITITMFIIIMLLTAMTATFLWYITQSGVYASSILGFTFVFFLLIASIIGLSKTVKFYKAYSEIRDGLHEDVSASPSSELQNETEAETAKLEAETQRQLTPIDAESEIGSASESATTRELIDAQRTETETKRLSEFPKQTKDKS